MFPVHQLPPPGRTHPELSAKKSRPAGRSPGTGGRSGGVVPGLLVLAVAENAGESLLPGLKHGPRTGLCQWATVSWPFSASKATLALKAGLCFLRPCDISCSFRQQPLPSGTCPNFRVHLSSLPVPAEPPRWRRPSGTPPRTSPSAKAAPQRYCPGTSPCRPC